MQNLSQAIMIISSILKAYKPEEISTICMHCKKWIKGPKDIDPSKTSHGICPICMDKYYPDIAEENRQNNVLEEAVAHMKGI